MTARITALLLFACAFGACGGNAKIDPRYPPRAEGCDVKVFRGKVSPGIAYDDIGRVDSICSLDISADDCMKELKNQACKLGGDILYDVPDEPLKPSPDKVRYIGHVAHTRVGPANK